jgi:hypothetical protein
MAETLRAKVMGAIISSKYRCTCKYASALPEVARLMLPRYSLYAWHAINRIGNRFVFCSACVVFLWTHVGDLQYVGSFITQRYVHLIL